MFLHPFLHSFLRPLLPPVAPLAAPVSGIPALTAPLRGTWPGGVTTLTIKQGDFGEWLKVQIADAIGPVDLSAATNITITLRGLYDPSGLLSKTAVLPSGVTDTAAYQLVDGDTDKPGDYSVEIRITWSNGRVRTSNLLQLSILADLG